MEAFWQRELAEAAVLRARLTVLAGFNVNLDWVVHLGPGTWEALVRSCPEATPQGIAAAAEQPPQEVRRPRELLAWLWNRLAQGRSLHLTVEAEEVLDWLDEELDPHHVRVGGQAGIIANQMARLRQESRLVTPLLSPLQARYLDPGVLAPTLEGGRLRWVPVEEAAQPVPTKVNWILEYDREQRYRLGDREVRVPRSNRVIVASRPRGLVMAFPAALEPSMADVASGLDLALLAGYHYAAPTLPDGRTFDAYLSDSLRHLKALKAANPHVLIHLEYVPMKHQALERELLAALGPVVDSLGINEVELRGVLERAGEAALAQELREHERPYALYRGARALVERFGYQRVQVHNLGYYCLVRRLSPGAGLDEGLLRRQIEAMRRGGLFGSAVTEHRARQGTEATLADVAREAATPLSDLGLSAVASFEAEIRAREAVAPIGPGGFRSGDMLVQVVPAHVHDQPVVTVGMGDTISSASLLAERAFLGKASRSPGAFRS
ncbi:MAG TPA: ADP-dependent glucokinase/phosphofructokinase [Limnochorda sp.]